MEFAGDQQSLVAALPGWAGMSALRQKLPFLRRQLVTFHRAPRTPF
jgi:hypothetical protein